MRKIIVAFVLCLLGLSLCSCNAKDDLSQLNYSYMCDEKSFEVIKDKDEEKSYLYQPETMRARDREVIIIGKRYTINVDIDAIMKEGDWDSYEFKKVDPTLAYTDQEGNVYLDKDTINENAFAIYNNEIVGHEKGRYGVYLKLTKKKKTLLRYIGDYIVTDENYSDFERITSEEDWFTKLTSTSSIGKYYILKDKITITKTEWKDPELWGCVLLAPFGGYIDFNGAIIPHCIFGGMRLCYLNNIWFSNFTFKKMEIDEGNWISKSVMGDVYDCIIKGGGLSNVKIEDNPDLSNYETHLFTSFGRSKFYQYTLSLEMYEDNLLFADDITIIQSSSCFEDIRIRIDSKVDSVRIGIPFSLNPSSVYIKNFLVINSDPKKEVFVTIGNLNGTYPDYPEDYYDARLKQQIVNATCVYCLNPGYRVWKDKWYIRNVLDWIYF